MCSINGTCVNDTKIIILLDTAKSLIIMIYKLLTGGLLSGFLALPQIS